MYNLRKVGYFKEEGIDGLNSAKAAQKTTF